MAQSPLTKCFDPNFSLSYLGVVPLYDDVFVFTGLRGNRGYLQLSKIFTSYLYDKTRGISLAGQIYQKIKRLIILSNTIVYRLDREFIDGLQKWVGSDKTLQNP